METSLLSPAVATPYEKLMTAEEIENLAATLYRTLAERFAHVPEAKSLFERLSAEEVQHAIRIRMMRTQYRQSPELFDGVKLESIDELMADSRALLDLFRNPQAELKYEEVLTMMANVERRFSRVHADAMASAADPKIKKFFEMLSKGDSAHAEFLGGRPRS